MAKKPVISRKNPGENTPTASIWCERVAFFLLACLITFLPFVYSRQTKSNFIIVKQLLFEPAVWIISLFWVASMALEGRPRFERSKLYIWAGLFLLTCLLSLANARPFYDSALELRAWLAAGLGFALAVNLVRTRRRLVIVMAGMALPCVLEAFWGTLQYMNRDFILHVEGREMGGMGTIGNSNYLGGLLAMLIFPLLATIIIAVNKAGDTVPASKAMNGFRGKVMSAYFLIAVGLLLVALSVAGLLYTDCQSAYIGAGVGFAVFGVAAIIFRDKGDKGLKLDKGLKPLVYKRAVPVVIMAGLVMVATALAGVWAYTGRNPAHLANLGERATSGRIIMWRATELMIRDHPVLGTGVGTYAYHYLEYLSRFLEGRNIKSIIHLLQNAEKPHNAYLQIWSETGSLGLAAFLTLIAVYFFNSLAILKKCDDKADRVAILGAACGQLAFLTTISVSSLLVISPLREYFWLFLGLRGGLGAVENNSPKGGMGKGGMDKRGLSVKWGKPICYILAVFTAAGLVFGLKHSLRLYRANVAWEKGALATKAGRYNDAIAWYTQAIKITPANRKLYFYRGSILMKLAGDVKDPKMRMDMQSRGVGELEFSAQGYSDVNLFSNLGRIYFEMGDMEKSVYWCRKAAGPGLEYASSHLNLGVALMSAGRAEEAGEEFAGILEVAPSFAPARFNLGLVNMRQKRFDEAAADFRKYTKLRPSNPDGFNNLGLSLMESGKATEAVSAFKEALRQKPDHLRAMNNLGAAYQRMGLYQQAGRQWRKVLRLDPDNKIARQNLEKLDEGP